jgi:ParB family chromosome partitioning protein
MSDKLPAASNGGDVVIYDPDRGLKNIAVAEAAEKHSRRAWRESKDPFAREQLEKAIDKKIDEQVHYILWRDGIVVHGDGPGRGHKGPKEISELQSLLPDADPGDVTAHRWRKRFFAKRGEPDAEKIALAKCDAKHRSVRICEQENDGTVRGTEGTGEFERYTPAEYIEAVRMVLGQIDLDPATSDEAQRTVNALEYFTVDDDGLSRDWCGCVFLNPPYHRDLAPKFINKLIEELRNGHVVAAIVLTNNCSDTDWFNIAIADSAGLCFTHGRIKFTVPGKAEPVLPTQGQTFFYFGDDVQRFEDVFCVIGACVRLSRAYEGQ